jgi:group I intron endonuclease
VLKSFERKSYALSAAKRSHFHAFFFHQFLSININLFDITRGHSSVGRAPALHVGSAGFDSQCLQMIFDIKRFFVSDITPITKNKVDKNSHEIVMLKKIEISKGFFDVMPTEYHKVFKTLTRQEFSKIRKEFAKIPLIYLWRNKETKHCYVGSSINFGNRLYGYICISNISRNNNIIYKAIEKYSHTAFELYILETHIGINKNDLLLQEDYWTFLVNPSYNVKRKKYFVLNEILYKMPQLNASAYGKIVKILAERDSLLEYIGTKPTYKPVFLFEKKTQRLVHYFYRTDLLCDFINKSRDYVKARLNKNVTITVKNMECYIQSLDVFVKPTQPFYGTLEASHNKKVYCFYAEDNKDLCIKKGQLVKEFINVKSFLEYTGKSKGGYYMSCIDKPKVFEFIKDNMKHYWYIQKVPSFIKH